MTIIKSQGQTLKFAGIDLRKHCFFHGQFYVACSRVSSPNSLIVLAPNDRLVKNIVYKVKVQFSHTLNKSKAAKTIPN